MIYKIGNRLKSLREKFNMSIGELAKEIDEPETKIIAIENGQKCYFSISLLMKVANFFNVSCDYLLGRTDKEELL